MSQELSDARVYGTLPSGSESCAGKAATADEVHPQVKWLFGVKRFVLVFWIGLAAIALPFAPTVFDRLNFEASPLKGSDLARAERLIAADFPDLVQSMPLVVLISCSEQCDTVMDGSTVLALQEISDLLSQLNETSPGLISGWERPSDLAALQEAAAAGQTVQVSADQQSLIWLSSWILPRAGQDRMMASVRRVTGLVEKLNREAGSFGHTIALQGLPALKERFKATTEREFLLKDVLTVPFALGVFLYQVQSWRLALLTAVCIVISISTGLAALVFVLNGGINLNTMTPVMMLVTCVAMSVDYAMFIMARFSEELQSGRRVEAALSEALVQGGGAVALSGCILILCYASCLLFPGDMIFTLAIGAIIILVLCLLISLSFAPCAIATFPDFFSRGVNGARADSQRGSRGWFKMGAWLTTWPFPVVVPLVIYACMLPVIWQLGQFSTTNDVRVEMPGGDLLRSYDQLHTAFPSAGTSPIFFYLDSAGQGVKSDKFFDDTCALVHQLVESTRGTDHSLQLDDFQSVVLAPVDRMASSAGQSGEQLTRALSSCPQVVCLRWSSSPPECPLLPSARDLLEGTGAASRLAPAAVAVYQRAWASLVSQSSTSSVVALETSLPEGETAKREAWEDIKGSAGCPVYWHYAIENDMIREDYARFPLVALLSVGAMFVLIGGSFKAALVPFKLFLTVVAPLAFVFGLLLMAYELGDLDWLHLPHVNSDFGLHWTIPILSAPVLMGLAVDYDVFLFARAYELRRLGFENRAAVVGALATTGPIISGAGLVMALAFGGMLLSDMRLNCEVGFALSVGVLLDTFVVRPFLAPSLLVLGGSLNFWPQKLPEASRSIEEMEDWLLASKQPEGGRSFADQAGSAKSGGPPPGGAAGATPASRLLGDAHP